MINIQNFKNMCWIENTRSFDLQIANKDIEVYKIVSDASNSEFKIKFNQFLNETKQRLQKEFDEM